MLAFVPFLVLTALCGTNSDRLLSKLVEKNGRQKRLLFYDDQGQIVKTYGNSLYHFGQNEQDNLFHWSFLNMFFNPIFPTNLGRTAITYMVPVSDAVIQQVNRDPNYQNKLFAISYKDSTVEVNPLCSGKRTQIPSPALCNNFLNCWDGWAFEQECPADLVFSVEGYCDYPQNVDCSKRKLPERPDPKCKNDFQAFSSITNCSEFFVCVNSIPVKFQCPADLAYSEMNRDLITGIFTTRSVAFHGESRIDSYAYMERRLHYDYNVYYTDQRRNQLPEIDDKVVQPSGYKSERHCIFRFKTKTYNYLRLGVCDYPYLVECNMSKALSKPASTQTTQASTEAIMTSASPAASVTPPPIPYLSPGSANENVITNKMEYNMHSWTSTHVAVSRQDAIRQLKLGQIAQVQTKK